MSKKRRKRRRIDPIRLGVVVLTAILILYLVIVGIRNVWNRYFPKQEEEVVASVDPINRHSYNWDYLSRDDGLYSYDDGTYTSMVGVDVSYVQKNVDWAKLKNAGIEFAMIRVGYRGYSTGEIHEDDYFLQNIQGALDAGIEVGVYFFSQAITEDEAIEEAEFVLAEIADYNVTFPIAYDMEPANEYGRINTLSQSEMTDMALAFTDRIQQAGYETYVYGASSWLMGSVSLTRLQNETKFWMAAYNVKSPAYVYEFEMWQYSSTTYLNGISGPVDMNIRFIKKDDADSSD